MRQQRWRRATLEADRGYDTRRFIEAMRDPAVTAHVAQNGKNRRSAIDERTTRHDGYAVSQQKRRRVEEVFGWIKTIALQRRTHCLPPVLPHKPFLSLLDLRQHVIGIGSTLSAVSSKRFVIGPLLSGLCRGYLSSAHCLQKLSPIRDEQ